MSRLEPSIFEVCVSTPATPPVLSSLDTLDTERLL
jgi:hypothetical protein